MYPTLFEIGGVPIYTYGLFLAGACLLGLRIATQRARTRGFDDGTVRPVRVWVLLSGLAGARLLPLIVDGSHLTANRTGILDLLRSSGAFYGGLIAAVGLGLWRLRRTTLPPWTAFDLFAPATAAGLAVGRVGCFLAGCCFGRESSAPWAVTFSDPAAARLVGTPLGVALHPVQLYEAAAALVIFVALIALESRGRAYAGRTFWSFVLLYGAARFVLEYFRGDARGALGPLSTSQALSALCVPVSIAMLVVLGRRPAPDPLPARRAEAA